MQKKGRTIDVFSRIYNVLLYAYPASFRREYGPQMSQVFLDDSLATMEESGSLGLLRLWFLTITDLLKTALFEHVSELFHEPSKYLQRWSGPAAAIGGLLYSYIFYIKVQLSLPAVILYFLSAMLLMTVGLTGLYHRLPASLGRANTAVLVVTIFGVVLLTAGGLGLFLNGGDANWTVISVGYYALILGIAGLGLFSLATNSLGILSFVPLILAVSFLGIARTIFTYRQSLQAFFVLICAVSWLLLGYALWSRRKERREPALTS